MKEQYAQLHGTQLLSKNVGCGPDSGLVYCQSKKKIFWHHTPPTFFR